jgi:hypothetical protein
VRVILITGHVVWVKDATGWQFSDAELEITGKRNKVLAWFKHVNVVAYFFDNEDIEIDAGKTSGPTPK